MDRKLWPTLEMGDEEELHSRKKQQKRKTKRNTVNKALQMGVDPKEVQVPEINSSARGSE